MHTNELRLPAEYRGRPTIRGVSFDRYFVAGLLLLAVVGFLVISALSSLVLRFPQFGALAAVAIVLIIPLAVLAGILGIPQLFRKLSVLRSKLQWWHALWLLLYISTLVFRVRSQEATQAAPLDAWAMVRIVPEAIVVAWLMIRLHRQRDAAAWARVMFQGLIGLLTIFALVCAASTIWSVYPAWTLYKSLEYLLDISVLGAALANIRNLNDYEDLFNWTWTIFGLELAWVWLQVPLWPSESFVDQRLKGFLPATGSNAVGQSGAFLAIIALCRLLPLTGRRSNTSFSVVLFAFGMLSLLVSQTRNAIGGLAVAVLLVFVLSKRSWLAGLMGVFGSLAWFLTPLGDKVIAYLQRDQSEAAMKSLTGRAAFWSYAWDQFLQHPLNGMGAYAGGRFFVMTKLGIDTATLHSDWIELLVGVGLLGLIPFVLMLLGIWRFLIRGVYDRTLDPRGRQMAYEAAGVLAVVTVHSFFNVELIWHVPLLLFVLLGYAEMLRRRGKVTAPQAVPHLFARPATVRIHSIPS